MIAVQIFVCFTLICFAFGNTHQQFEFDIQRHWDDFKRIHNKQYSNSEEVYRRSVFTRNLHKIITHNIEADLGLHSYTLGVNGFTDFTLEEFSYLFKGYSGQTAKRLPRNLHKVNRNQTIPDSVDWRTQNLVTPVKNQKQCGSCWAFSAVAAIEGQHAKATKDLVSLSEQNLVDCSRPQGNMGCGGGLMDNAFEYVIQNNGIDTENSYPYEAVDGDCRFNPNTIGATISSYKDIPSGDENALTDAIANIGPISVAIDAASLNFQMYRSGVYDDESCGTQLDHGVTAVGYGTDGASGKEYYLVKNSWGTSWGEKGYIRMSRNKGDQCGIALQSSYPIV